ncbi:putative uridine nucleosidase [Neofusicoccum parvum]|nr:putative uridine nucleosidase [Neofusicoccum parvum]
MAAAASSITPLWLDVDPGHDDAFALLLAAHNPQVHLLGVSTVHGNASLEHTTQNSLSILEAIGCRDIPVYPGASTAWLVATGTLTNAARVIKEHPDLAGHLKGFSIMGGAIGNGFTDAPLGKIAGEGERFGNWTPYAEFNCDPEAAQFLLTHPIIAPKTTIMPLDVTHQVLGTSAVQTKLLHLPSSPSSKKPLPTPIRALFHEIMTFFAKTYAEEFALTEGPPLHDPLAVAATFAPDLFDDNAGERFSVDVVTQGEHRADPAQNRADAEAVGQLGRTLVTKVDGEGVRIPRRLDVARFWDMIDEALAKAEETSPLPALEGDWWKTRV